MFQNILVYLGYLDERDVDGKYHEKTHCRFKKLKLNMDKDDSEN